MAAGGEPTLTDLGPSSKVGPEKSWMPKEAAGHFDSGSIGYETVHGPAHGHISLAEEDIQAAKGGDGPRRPIL